MTAPAEGPVAPLIVTAIFGAGDFSWLEGLRRAHYPSERNRVPAHLTLLHHLMPSLAAELRDRLGGLSALSPPQAEIVGVQDLGSGTAFRVRSPELEDMRSELAAAFRGLLTPQDQAPWRPHITVQNKVERRKAIALQSELEARSYPRPLAISGLASWRYLGGPWEPLRTYKFRG